MMKIAVTYENGQIFQHFGHTEQFPMFTVTTMTTRTAKPATPAVTTAAASIAAIDRKRALTHAGSENTGKQFYHTIRAW